MVEVYSEAVESQILSQLQLSVHYLYIVIFLLEKFKLINTSGRIEICAYKPSAFRIIPIPSLLL
jgi:hypothetical protein